MSQINVSTGILSPDKVGVIVRCKTCGHTKKPLGRSGPLGAHFCEQPYPGDPPGYGCEDYYNDPKPGSLWPGESEEDYGYPVGIDGTTRAESHA